VRAVLEPRAPPSKDRMEAMRLAQKAGLVTGVTILPVVPFITDRAGELEDIVSACAEYGAQYILYGVMTMRDRQASHFYCMLHRHYPGLVKKYDGFYRGRYTPEASCIHKLNLRLWRACRRTGIPISAPRPVPRGCLADNIAVSTIFYEQARLLEMEGDFRGARPYRGTARKIDELTEPLDDVPGERWLKELGGAGKKLAAQASEALMTGDFGEHQEQKKRLDRLAEEQTG